MGLFGTKRRVVQGEVKEVAGRVLGGHYKGFGAVEKAFVLYCKGESRANIAKACGISVPTVQNYIHRGVPGFGIPSFESRRIAIYEEVMHATDSKIVDAVTRTRELLVTAAETISNRVVERINASPILEDPALYTEGFEAERAAAYARAFNPGVKELRMAAEALASFEKSIRTSSPSTSVSVSQDVAVEATADVVRPEEIDFIVNHLDGLQSKSEDVLQRGQDVARAVSLRQEIPIGEATSQILEASCGPLDCVDDE